MIQGTLTLAVLISYITASAKDPGTLRSDQNLPFLELLQKFSPTDLCPDCEVIRTPRSRHCAICNVCIERYDHHCPWINNCVGIRNHNAFLAFITSTSLYIIFSVFIIIYSNIFIITNPYSLCVEICRQWYRCRSEVPLPVQTMWQRNRMVHMPLIASAGLNLVLIPCLVRYNIFWDIACSLLFYVHLKNYINGKTTNERFSRKAQSSFSEDDSNFGTTTYKF